MDGESNNLKELIVEELLGSHKVHKQVIQNNATSIEMEQALELNWLLGNRRSWCGSFNHHSGRKWYWGRGNKLISRDQHQQTNTSRGRGRRGYGDTQGHGNTELFPKL